MRQKYKKILASSAAVLFIIFFVMGMILSGALPSDTDDDSYNGHSFERTNNGFMTVIDGNALFFYNHPADLAGIAVNDTVLSALSGKNMAYITSDANSTEREAIGAVSYNLELALKSGDIFVGKGFTSDNEFGAPVVGCSNATEHVPVVLIQLANNSAIGLENSCIIINGSSSWEITRLADRLSYGILGVIE